MKLKGVLIIFGILILVSGVLAEGEVSDDVQKFVKKVAEKKGMSEIDIENITEVDFANLPKEINISNIDETNLGVYQVKSKNQTEKPTFIVTFSGKTIEKLEQSTAVARSFLNFGKGGEFNESTFLQSSSGVVQGLSKGYVMIRKGSITGISSNTEIVKQDLQGEVNVVVYKNGETINFGNVLETSTIGLENDYSLQSENIVTFIPGDVISVYVNINGNVVVKDLTTMLEITTN